MTLIRKPLIGLLLGVTALGIANEILQVTNSVQVTTRRWHKDANGDGTPEFAGATHYRGRARVLVESTRISGERHRVFRLYYVRGAEKLLELDSDGDGRWEMLVVVGKDGHILEAFKRNDRNEIIVAEAATLQALRNDDACWRGFWESVVK